MEPCDFYEMNEADMAEYCRADGRKWAEAFCKIKECQGWSSDDIDIGLMTGWFASAIESSSALRLSAQQREPVVRVKELEWFRDSMKCSYPARYKATTHDGLCDYSVSGSESDNEWRWFRNGYYACGHYLHNPMTLDEAKSAAQADYERRIMAAIEIIPAGAGASSDGGAKAGSSPILASEEDKRAGAHGVMPVGTIADAAGCTDAGPSEAIADVSVDELAGFFVTEFPHLLTMSTQIEAARALLASYRNGRR